MRGSQAYKKYSQPSTLNTKIITKNQINVNKTHKRNVSSDNITNKSTSKIKRKESVKEKDCKNNVNQKNCHVKKVANISPNIEKISDDYKKIFKIKIDNIDSLAHTQLDSSLNSLSLDKKDINQTNISIKQTFGNNYETDMPNIKIKENEIQESKNKTFYNTKNDNNAMLNNNHGFESENYYDRFFNLGNCNDYNIFGQPIHQSDLNNSDIYKGNKEDSDKIEKQSQNFKITGKLYLLI